MIWTLHPAFLVGLTLIGLHVKAGPELDAALWLIGRESRFDHRARNPRSTAHGYGQLLDRTWRGLASRAGRRVSRHDPRDQLVMFVRYVRERYGSFQRAKAFHVKRGWY